MNRVLAILHAAAVPDPAATAPPGLGPKILLLLGGIKWIALIAGVAALIAVGVLLAVQRRRGEASEGVTHVITALVGIAIASSAAALVGWMQ